MNQQPSSTLKVVYCLVLVAAALPFGLAEYGWIGLVVRGVGPGLVPSLGPFVFVGLALYRIYLVARVPDVLGAPRATGFAAVLRKAGVVLLYVGALSAIVSWIGNPLIRAVMKDGADVGARFFLEFYLYMAAGIGMLGLALFEISRLLSFERAALRASV